MELMVRESIDGLIAQLPVNSYYLSNYWGLLNTPSGYDGSYFALLPRDPQAPAALIVPASELRRLDSQKNKGHGTWMSDIYAYSGPLDDEHEANAFQALTRAVTAAGLETTRLATDDARTSMWLAGCGLERAEFIYQPMLFNEIRLIKTAAEIEVMKQAAHINEMSLLLAAESMEVGSTWEELENMYMMTMAQQGGHGVCLTGSGDELPPVSVRAGEPVPFAALGQYQHYHGGFGRCGVVGEADKSFRKRHAHMLAGWETAQDMLRPGVTYSEFSQAVGDTVRAAGISAFRNPVIHSLGLEHCDDPKVFGAPPPGASDQTLQPGMVVTVGLSHAENGWGSLHLEDTIGITSYGHERFGTSDLSIRIA